MRIDRLKKPFKSVFTKIIICLIVSGIFLVVGVFGIILHGFLEDQDNRFRNNMAQYASYLVDDLRRNLNVEHARDLSRRLYFIIRFESEEESWQTGPGIPPLDRIKFRKKTDYNDGKSGESFLLVVRSYHPEVTRVRTGRFRGQWVVVLDFKDQRFIFAEEIHENRILKAIPWVIGILLFILFTLTTTWLVLKWILKPINWLSDGVTAIGAGQLDYRLPEKRKDELGHLARAFNRMTERLKEMLNAREQLLLDVSHELRSPLTRMKIALEFIPEDASRDSLLDDVQEMEQMITEILESARLKSEHGKLNKQYLDLVPLVQETCMSFDGQAPGIQVENLPDECMATVDGEQIQTVLKNLISNALKYSPAESAPVVLAMQSDESGISIQVTDHGKGIPEEEQEMIFEPFYRVDKSRTKSTGGYGLGLNLCKTIIETHGGQISVGSSMNSGATFTVFLPHSSTR